jgi:hypothetical protein
MTTGLFHRSQMLSEPGTRTSHAFVTSESAERGTTFASFCGPSTSGAANSGS